MSTEPTRRAVIKAGAWSAPLIVVATAAPALAASPAALLSISYSRIQVTGNILRFATTVDNTGSRVTTDLRASVSVTAPSSGSWGTTPSVAVTNFASGASNTTAAWTYLSFSGTGSTRTFLFDAKLELTPGNGFFFDFEINTNGTAIGPGTLVRTFTPGGNGTPVTRTDNYAATVARAARETGDRN